MSTPRALLIVALTFFLGACQQPGGQAGSAVQETANAEEQNKAALARIYEIINTGNLDAAGDVIAVDAIEHQMMPGMTEGGLAGFKQSITLFRQAFPDLHMVADQMIADGDYVAARFTMSGTQSGPFMDRPASGNRFEVSGIDFIRFENGKAAEHWGYQDDMSLMEQLGMIPEEGAPAP
jgi:steroid delta-isomerase-like uncharacterized protein